MYISKSVFNIRTLSVKFKDSWNGLNTIDKRFLAVLQILIWQGGNRIQGLELGLYVTGQSNTENVTQLCQGSSIT